MWTCLASLVAKALIYGVVLVAGLWCWFQWRHWDLLQAARRLPSPVKPLPIIGHSHLVLFRSLEDITKLAIEVFSIGSVSRGLYNVTAWCGPLPILMIHKPEDIQKVLTSSSTMEKGDEVEYLRYVIGNGILTAPCRVWKITRRHINPLFHPRNIEQLMTVFNRNSGELVTELVEHVDGGTLDMLHPIMGTSFKTVCQLIFGTELDFDKKSKVFKDMIKAVHDVSAFYVMRLINPWLRLDFIFNLFYNAEVKRINNCVYSFSKSPMKISKDNHAKKESISSRCFQDNEGFKSESSLNLIDVFTILQKECPQFTDEDLMSEIKTLYGTGSDTVGIAVSSCLLVLGKYHHIQERLFEEIMSVVGPDDDVTMDHISKMQYLDQVYKETLRWAVIVPYIIRKTTEEIQLSDCTIPAGNSVVVCLIGPHMDPTIYPNPLTFDPERFATEEVANRRKDDFVPLGSGIRMCIGKIYSDYLVKTMLVHVLRRYKLSTEMDIHSLKKKLTITLVNSDGYLVKIKNRK